MNNKRFWMVAIPVILMLVWVDYYVNNYYPVEHILRLGTKTTMLKDVKAERVTLEQAKKIIGENNLSKKVEEITSDEIFNKTGCQIFKDDERDTYLIKSGTAYKLGEDPPMLGVMDACVADLNNDGVPELIYTYSYGGGYWCSKAAIITLDKEAAELKSNFHCKGYLYLDKADNQCVVLKLYDRGVRGRIVGPLYLEKTDKGDLLQVKLRTNPSDEVEERMRYSK